jgi:hypothetical protein
MRFISAKLEFPDMVLHDIFISKFPVLIIDICKIAKFAKRRPSLLYFQAKKENLAN